jgi:PAS domain S-box-containing protein
MNRSASILSALGKAYYLLQSDLNLREILPKILSFFGEASNVDRIYIFKNHLAKDGELLFSYKFEWCALGVEPQIDLDLLQNAPWSIYPEILAKLSNNEVINELVRDTVNKDFYHTMNEQGILSYLFIPVFSGEVFWGFIGFDNCKSEKLFTDEQASALHAFASTLGNTVLVRSQQKRLLRSQRNYRFLVNNINDVVFRYDLSGKFHFLNTAWETITGFSIEESIGKTIFSFIEKPCNEALKEQMDLVVSNKKTRFEKELQLRTIHGKSVWVKMEGALFSDRRGEAIGVFGTMIYIDKEKRYLEALTESEERFRTITENIPFPMIICSLENGLIYYLNKDFREIMGFEGHDSILNFSLDEIFVLPNQEGQVFDYLAGQNEVNGLEVKLIIEDQKEELWYSLSSQRILYQEKEVLVLILYDIRDRKKAEEKALKLNGLLQAVNESQLHFFLQEDFNSPMGILLEKMLHLTESKFGFIGEVLYSEDNLPYLKSHAISNISWSEETRVFYLENFRSGIEFRNLDTLFGVSLKTGEIVISNQAYADPRAGGTPPGHPRLERYLGIPVFKGEEFLGLIGIANRDYDYVLGDVEFLEPLISGYANLIQAIRIQRRKKESDKMRKHADDMYRLLSENTGDIIALHDLDMSFKYVSPSIEKVLGYTPADILGKTPVEVFGVPDVKKQVGNQLKVVFPHKHKTNGTTVYLEVLLKQLEDEKGNVFSILATSRDVTEREMSIKELKKAIIKERELNQLKSRFISMASHEFRTPLSTIMSSTELLRLISEKEDKEISKEQLTVHLGRITNQIKRLDNVINDVLILEKNEQGKIITNSQPIYIIGFISSLISEINEDKNRSQKVCVYFPENEKLIYSDSVWLTHIIKNIVENALKYSLPGSMPPELTLSYKARGIEITVKDYGVGIPKEDQKFIFDSFFRSKNVSNIKGTGLGLSIVGEFVKKLKGKIKFKSEIDKGSEFIIQLPYKA